MPATNLPAYKRMINVTNDGTTPATNLSLILSANNKTITDITNLFSTVNVTLAIPESPHSLLKINRLLPINGSFVELHVKKFVNGGGSIIKLAFGVKDETILDYTTVYITYDQGSKKSTDDPREQGIHSPPPIFIYLVVAAAALMTIYVLMIFTQN